MIHRHMPFEDPAGYRPPGIHVRPAILIERRGMRLWIPMLCAYDPAPEFSQLECQFIFRMWLQCDRGHRGAAEEAPGRERAASPTAQFNYVMSAAHPCRHNHLTLLFIDCLGAGLGMSLMIFSTAIRPMGSSAGARAVAAA